MLINRFVTWVPDHYKDNHCLNMHKPVSIFPFLLEKTIYWLALSCSSTLVSQRSMKGIDTHVTISVWESSKKYHEYREKYNITYKNVLLWSWLVQLCSLRGFPSQNVAESLDLSWYFNLHITLRHVSTEMNSPNQMTLYKMSCRALFSLEAFETFKSTT